MFVNYTLKPNSGLFSTGVNFRELQTRGRRLKGLFPMTSRRKLHKRWETVSQRVYEGETIETGFARRRRKVWTVASRLILSSFIPHFQLVTKKKKTKKKVSENILRTFFGETLLAGLHFSKWKILIRNKTIRFTVVGKKANI